MGWLGSASWFLLEVGNGGGCPVSEAGISQKHYWLDIWDCFFHHTFDSGAWLLAESMAGGENAVTRAAPSMAAGSKRGIPRVSLLGHPGEKQQGFLDLAFQAPLSRVRWPGRPRQPSLRCRPSLSSNTLTREGTGLRMAIFRDHLPWCLWGVSPEKALCNLHPGAK